MARTKLSPEEKAKQEAVRAEEHRISILASQKKELIEKVTWGFVGTPTRQFEIGESVVWGHHNNTVVLEKELEGQIYLTHTDSVKEADRESYQRESHTISTQWQSWVDLTKIFDVEEARAREKFSVKDDVNLQFLQSTINSFDTYVYHFGIDMNPDYQRGLVWSLEDKQSLIDSIFNNVDIGKFSLIQRDYETAKKTTQHTYEVLDGKQRLTALIEFREDRFRYKGKLFSELHFADQIHINGYSISVAHVKDMTKEQIYRYFLKLNTSGKPMDGKHLDHVKDLWLKELAKK